MSSEDPYRCANGSLRVVWDGEGTGSFYMHVECPGCKVKDDLIQHLTSVNQHLKDQAFREVAANAALRMTGEYCRFCGHTLRRSKCDDNQVCDGCNSIFMSSECLPLRREAKGC